MEDRTENELQTAQEKAADSFGSGVFWELYRDLERQFQTFLNYVPYLEGNQRTYSFVLLNLILSIGGYVDSAFKEMVRYRGFADNADCEKILAKLKESSARIEVGKAPVTIPIDAPLRLFEKRYALSKRRVVFKPNREGVVPFTPHNPRTNAPRWWDVYNGLKHDVGLNLGEANLRAARDALAGAFVLNVVHVPSVVRFYEYGILRQTHNLMPFKVTAEGKQRIETWAKENRGIGVVETPLFLCDYEASPSSR